MFRDPWGALDAYIRVVLCRGENETRGFLSEVAGRDLAYEEEIRALKLLEMERHGQLMFTSCAWFFDEVSGIETVQGLKMAARAMQLAERNFRVHLEQDFLGILEKAPSNDPEIRDARRLWEDEVRPAAADLERVLAHSSINLVFQKGPSPRVGNAYSVNSLDTSIQEKGQAHFAIGAAEVVSHVTLERTQAVYAVLHSGGMDVQFFWMPHHACGDYGTLKADLRRMFQNGLFGVLHQRLLQDFKGSTHQLKDLFRDEQRKIVEVTLKERIQDYQAQLEQLFEQDRALLKRLAVLRYPIPEPMIIAARECTERRIRELAGRLEIPEDLQGFSQLLEEARQWGYRPENSTWERFFLSRLERCVRELHHVEAVGSTLAKAGTLLEAAELLEVKLNLWNIQNLYLEVCNQRATLLEAHREAVISFASRIQMTPEALPPNLR